MSWFAVGEKSIRITLVLPSIRLKSRREREYDKALSIARINATKCSHFNVRYSARVYMAEQDALRSLPRRERAEWKRQLVRW